ncbi:MAG TPA: SDR family oxidoreductase [Armatimonadota bacterium]|nr:SDR family oxidoreductase [Armatimonadota bacterium]HOP79756.1 SDR family oxidoreductase [Armatimonadota bacterium]HPP73911.1 SDR family oxidoreductase [Armatimonadota bacterium]
MARRFEGKVALVTGGAAGLGLATALAFAREGASVVIADVKEEAGQAAVQKITDTGGKAIFVKTDVSRAEEVKMLIDKTVETFGRLDCAFNNAGIEGKSASTADCTEENWDRVININLKGLWLCMKYEIPQMLKQGGGAIVNMSSVAGLVGFEGMPAYCASKGGVIQLTKTAALEYARNGIRVNAVCPGGIETEMIERVATTSPEMKQNLINMHPVGRLGRPEEVADVVLWLCSDESSFVTGYPVAIDGGFVAR